MIITYRFDMTDIDDRWEQNITGKAADLHGAIRDIDNWLRDKIKFDPDEKRCALLQSARDELGSALSERDLVGLFL